MIITSYDMQSDDDLSIKNTELYIYIYIYIINTKSKTISYKLSAQNTVRNTACKIGARNQ